jgi:hypothetical protein
LGPAGVVHTSVSVVHVSVAPQLVDCAHEAPSFGAGAHVPHALPGTMLQKPVWHWDAYSQAPPLATEPSAGVLPVEGAPSASTQDALTRSSQVGSPP